MQHALNTQMRALKLCDVELERLSSTPSSSKGKKAELHKLWIQHHQSVLELHVGETIYAMGKGKGNALRWIDQAKMRAQEVGRVLQRDEKAEEDVKECKVVAKRVRRDANRVVEVADRFSKALKDER